MPVKQLTFFSVLIGVLLASGPLQAKNIAPQSSVNADSSTISPSIAHIAPQLLHMLPIFNPVPMLTQSIVPSVADALENANDTRTAAITGAGEGVVDGDPQANEQAQELAVDQDVTDLRKALIVMAMKLRHIRYVRGGHDPSTGFDCSGFVRYVFAHAIGLNLPRNSAEQFLAGLKVKRVDMEPGDLVFFRTHGKHRISHVGIYISDGRFIHSPTSGKSVEISSLDESYWAKRFAGAKRPESIALTADKG
ncbi:MAG: C40 family peptidase [Pseudomonadota bacterium]|nr:C40 family peptidase [Pseudomonadota bacterium]